MIRRLLLPLIVLTVASCLCADQDYETGVRAALDAKTDVFGTEVLRRGEPSYDLVKDYLRPVRMADWSRRYYPLVLSDVRSAAKARVLYEGAEIHLNIGTQADRAYRLPQFSASISVGDPAERFGSNEAGLVGPRLHGSGLPIYHWTYVSDGIAYRQTVFAVDEPDAGLVVYWRLESDKPSEIHVALQGAGDLDARDVRLIDKTTGLCWARFGPGAEFDSGTRTFRFAVEPGKPACMAFPNRPAPADAVFRADPASVESALRRCARHWRDFIDEGASISVPEDRVNEAYQATLCGIAMLTAGDCVRYSVGNSYEREYANETPNTIATLALLGQTDMARRLMEFHFGFQTKPGTEYYSAAWRLRTACLYYALTGDKEFLDADLPILRSLADTITSGLADGENGLLPRTAYAWDHPEIRINNLAHNCISWRALRDFGALLGTDGARYSRPAAQYRKAILAAVDKSVVKDGDQTFIPMSLLADEKPFARLSDNMLGSYYNIAITPVLWSGVFPKGSPRPEQLMDYQAHRAGIMLGLLRTGHGPTHDGYCNEAGINDVYGYPRNLYLLSTGRVDEFLLAFYPKLAHGLSRDTYVGAEATSVIPIADEYFRRMGRPPNSFSNANFLIMLRYMLARETDSNDDGIYDSLILASGTPRAWLEPGREIKAQRLPTAFGRVSYRIGSSKDGRLVSADIDLESRRTPRALAIVLRVPIGKTIKSVNINGRPTRAFDAGTGRITLPTGAGKIRVDAVLGAK